MANRVWTAAEDAILIADRASGVVSRITAEKLNRPIHATRLRALKLGATVQSHRSWTVDEREMVRAMVMSDPPATDKQIADRFQTTVSSARWVVSDLGLAGLRLTRMKESGREKVARRAAEKLKRDLARSAKAQEAEARRQARKEAALRDRLAAKAARAEADRARRSAERSRQAMSRMPAPKPVRQPAIRPPKRRNVIITQMTEHGIRTGIVPQETTVAPAAVRSPTDRPSAQDLGAERKVCVRDGGAAVSARGTADAASTRDRVVDAMIRQASVAEPDAQPMSRMEMIRAAAAKQKVKAAGRADAKRAENRLMRLLGVGAE